VAYAFLTLFTAFSGLLLYIVLWIVMPEKRI
jgi:phage shock protein PspC (stress-responsive transcriptional regulator)